jgi:hypothetical protein
LKSNQNLSEDSLFWIINICLDADKPESLRIFMESIAVNKPDFPLPPPKSLFWWRIALYSVPAIILLLLAVPNFVRARSTPCLNACINLLRQIDGAKDQFALEHKLPPGTLVNADQIAPYVKGGAIPSCPGDGTISIGPLGQPPTCSSREGHRLP